MNPAASLAEFLHQLEDVRRAARSGQCTKPVRSHCGVHAETPHAAVKIIISVAPTPARNTRLTVGVLQFELVSTPPCQAQN